ncbi:O-antigen ligase family protein [Flavobacterium succinicans]|uniref:O-antigen ligase n=1 Tax=Flavobacterium succinicans TaxID=29536 RepID=A0A199XQ13_9FLAO|nr:O-antigen ligase family protein [Flavobacterium succinicans]OAZ03346.1 O-antigen ligase [Flavobacterium succinicans]
MTISEKNFNKIFSFFLVAIACTLIFRKPCTWLIFAFAVFNIFYFKKTQWSKKALILATIIASPFLLELVFFWNNDSLVQGIKSIEKTSALVLFPLFILGNYQRISFLKLLRYYVNGTTLVMIVFTLRFLLVFPEYVTKYWHGVHLWEMGYVFANSIGIHAPALNMHLAFVSVAALYLLLDSWQIKKDYRTSILSVLVFVFSFFFVLLVNTRMALFNVLTGYLLVVFSFFLAHFNLKKMMLYSVAIGGVVLGILILFVQKNPYMKEKYGAVTFAYMDKVGKLDEIDHPEIKVFNSLVTRVSIWKSAWELSLQHLPFGVGASDGKPELVKYYKQTHQYFLAEYAFPTHNQFLDFLLKFGVLGPLVVLLYIGTIGYLGIDLKNALVFSFFFLFFTSNLTDDFLLRFDGITFSGFWFSIFGSLWLQQKNTVRTMPEVP